MDPNVTETIVTLRELLDQAVCRALTRATGPVKWGEDDCGAWVARPLLEVLGYDIAAKYRGKYHSREQAAKMFGTLGLLKGLRQQAKIHGWKQISPINAEVGDVGLALRVVNLEGRREPTCMICRAPGWFIGRSDDGFTALTAEFVARAWSVC